MFIATENSLITLRFILKMLHHKGETAYVQVSAQDSQLLSDLSQICGFVKFGSLPFDNAAFRLNQNSCFSYISDSIVGFDGIVIENTDVSRLFTDNTFSGVNVTNISEFINRPGMVIKNSRGSAVLVVDEDTIPVSIPTIIRLLDTGSIKVDSCQLPTEDNALSFSLVKA